MAKKRTATPKPSKPVKQVAAAALALEAPGRGRRIVADPLEAPPSSTRSKASQKAWDGIRSRLAELFPLTSDRTGAGELTSSLLRIEAGFNFAPLNGDDDFSELHIEPLLDQAADLLDRGVRDRAEYDETAARALLLALDIDVFAKLDGIHSMEEQFGYYDVAADESYSEYDASLQAEASYGSARSRVASTISQLFSPQKKLDVTAAAMKGAFVTGVPPYSYDSTPPVYPTYSINSGPLPVANHAEAAVQVQVRHSLDAEHQALLVQRDQYELFRFVAELQRPGLQSRMTWEHANRWFARQRTQVARNTNDIKAKAASEPDGILNYAKRLQSIRQRFRQDFRNALARLVRVEAGMRRVYGYNVPLPSNRKDINFFDDCLLWARAAIDWLVRFSRREQNVILPVSIRSALGDQAWQQGRSARRWAFSIAQAALPDFAHVRLRGLSAIAVQDEGSSTLWRVAIRAPRSGTVTHLSGHNEILNQTRVPPCDAARVTARQARRVPDVVGVSALHNASPFGEWQVALLDGLVAFGDLSTLQDLQLDLHLAYRVRGR